MNAETERSIHDALCVVRDLDRRTKIVAGGSAPEMEMAKLLLRDTQKPKSGREQLCNQSFRGSRLEIITTTLSENAGLDPIDILSELRSGTKKVNLGRHRSSTRQSQDMSKSRRLRTPHCQKTNNQISNTKPQL